MTTRIPERPIGGGCQCGSLRYSLDAEPLTLYCCHCSECQKQSAGAFGMSLRARPGDVRMQGTEAVFMRDPAEDTAVECVFCPTCGTRVLHRGRGGDSGLSIKAGTLDDRSWLRPVGHIWTASAQKWVILEGLRYDRQPDDDYAALIAAFRQQHGL